VSATEAEPGRVSFWRWEIRRDWCAVVDGHGQARLLVRRKSKALAVVEEALAPHWGSLISGDITDWQGQQLVGAIRAMAIVYPKDVRRG
jgi:hypothetical protein